MSLPLLCVCAGPGQGGQVEEEQQAQEPSLQPARHPQLLAAPHSLHHHLRHQRAPHHGCHGARHPCHALSRLVTLHSREHGCVTSQYTESRKAEVALTLRPECARAYSLGARWGGAGGVHYTVAGGAGSGCGHDFPGLSAANWGQPWLGDMGTNGGERGESNRLQDR